MKKFTKVITLVLALVLIAGLAVGGTAAYLIARTQAVTNVFTMGDIELELEEEHPGPYDMVPGTEITKDPKVTVRAGSESCWLFIRVTPSENWPEELDYEVNGRFSQGAGTDGIPTDVFYKNIPASDQDQVFEVLKDNMVGVSDKLVKGQITDEITLTITAYAIQRAGFDTAAKAWAEVQGNT